MTVIVARVGVGMASDTGLYSDTMFTTGARKVYRIRGGALFGGFGMFNAIKKYATFFNDGGNPPDPASMGIDPAEAVGLFLTPGAGGRIFYVESDGHLTPVNSTFYAAGAGGDLAIGALAMGADLKKAVEIASEFCNFVHGYHEELLDG